MVIGENATATSTAGIRAAFRPALQIMLNPGHVIRDLLNDVPLPFCFAASGLAFTFFFLQTGLDLWRAGSKSPAGVVALTLLGALYGTAGVAVVAALAWAVSRPLGGNRSIDWVLRAFALSYCPALIYAALGLLFNLAFSWHTSIAFGATGVLWALAPLIFACREMSGERPWVGVVLATLCGGLLLFGWAFIAA